MDVPLAVVADFASQDASGKLTIVGIFNRINVANFPYTHPQMHLALKIQPERGEYDEQRTVRVTLVNQDGQTLLGMEAKFMVSRPPDHVEADASIPLGMINVVFQKPGTYEFRIYIDRDQKRTVPFYVVQAPAAAES